MQRRIYLILKSEDPDRILDIINRLPNRQYNNMADVEKSVSNVI